MQNTCNDTYNEIVDSAIADNTRIAYSNGWRRFVGFCASRGYSSLPATPDAVVEFLIEQATQPVSARGERLAMGTVVLMRSAIMRQHADAGLPSPTHDPKVEGVLRALVRIRGGEVRRVKALRDMHICAMLRLCDQTPLGLRNAAIIALGFAGALRRSELCSIRVDDLEIVESPTLPTPEDESTIESGATESDAAKSNAPNADGTNAADAVGDVRTGAQTNAQTNANDDTPEVDRMFLHIRKSKTDQEGVGHKIAIVEGRRIRPISRLQTWLDAAGIESGYVFRSMRRGGHLRGSRLHHSDIPRILKHYAARIGLDASEIAGHSLRAGFVTSAAAHRARLDKIMEITRHRNPATVMRYIRDANAFDNHAGERFL
ncbi:MAG: tyrosine-type recombinase/integrase [bacterium]